jgi:hypothetical protein
LDHNHLAVNIVSRYSWCVGNRCKRITITIHISLVHTISHVSRVHLTHTYMVPEQKGVILIPVSTGFIFQRRYTFPGGCWRPY